MKNRMARNFDFCKNYAQSFDLSSFSILMMGETGLGKTHLSLAIANEVKSDYVLNPDISLDLLTQKYQIKEPRQKIIQ